MVLCGRYIKSSQSEISRIDYAELASEKLRASFGFLKIVWNPTELGFGGEIADNKDGACSHIKKFPKRNFPVLIMLELASEKLRSSFGFLKIVWNPTELGFGGEIGMLRNVN
ncbi:hypothetical protein CEXT_309941 [Caerostris extrusa]|uniref:Uncharacterized protein n=1 Tax=Caerostris extrusa TaxID=172846 RepID=A0AAV4UXU9_CAEEX|nr:hypothetical protein CEXT_309941 [Caerostris extrusa]